MRVRARLGRASVQSSSSWFAGLFATSRISLKRDVLNNASAFRPTSSPTQDYKQSVSCFSNTPPGGRSCGTYWVARGGLGVSSWLR